jgi:hypothetical protein
MTRLHARLLASSLAIACALMATPAASAFSDSVSAPVTRSGSRVGSATGAFVLADNGWAVTSVKAFSFRAPQANRSWRARTVLTSGCTEPGFDPSVDDPSTVQNVAVTVVSPWRTTRIAGTTGTLSTTDVVKECPAGLVPGGTMVLRLAIQSTSGASAGSALLFAAG